MTNVVSLNSAIFNQQPEIIENKPNNLYRLGFKAGENDRFVRQQPPMAQGVDPFYMEKMMREQEKQQKKQKLKSNLSWGIGIASGLAIIGMVMMQIKAMRGGGASLGKKPEELRTIWEDLTKAQTIEEMALPQGLKDLLEHVKSCTENPEVTKKRGGKSIGSILLYGPPGTGKTTFAKAIAKMFPDSKFASLDVTSLGSEYHSVTERNLNAAVDMICQEAQLNPKKKIFVFVDEIDSVMMQDEGKGAKLSNDILNEFKKCFTEKLGKHDNIITIGATNLEIDVEKAVAAGGKKLDKPMLDRFSQKVLVDLPTSEQIKNAVTGHYKDCELVDDILKNNADPIFNRVCDILSDKSHNVSFRTLASFYDETAASIKDETTKVTLKDFIKTILNKKSELKLTQSEVNELQSFLRP